MKKFKKHPSYGMVQFNRVSGSRSRIFGSSVTNHHSTIRLTIRRGQISHDLGHDSFFSNEDLIEVEMSPAQFVELLTTMNVGLGVPCNINFIQSDGSIDPPADEDVESDRVKTYFGDRVKETTDKLVAMGKRIHELGAKKRFNKSDVTSLLESVRMFVQEMEFNMPFYVDSFGKAVEKHVAQSKAEIDATTTLVLQRLGFQKLSELQAVMTDAPAQLEEPKPKRVPCKNCGCSKGNHPHLRCKGWVG